MCSPSIENTMSPCWGSYENQPTKDSVENLWKAFLFNQYINPAFRSLLWMPVIRDCGFELYDHLYYFDLNQSNYVLFSSVKSLSGNQYYSDDYVITALYVYFLFYYACKKFSKTCWAIRSKHCSTDVWIVSTVTMFLNKPRLVTVHTSGPRIKKKKNHIYHFLYPA